MGIIAAGFRALRSRPPRRAGPLRPSEATLCASIHELGAPRHGSPTFVAGVSESWSAELRLGGAHLVPRSASAFRIGTSVSADPVSFAGANDALAMRAVGQPPSRQRGRIATGEPPTRGPRRVGRVELGAPKAALSWGVGTRAALRIRPTSPPIRSPTLSLRSSAPGPTTGIRCGAGPWWSERSAPRGIAGCPGCSNACRARVRT